MKWAILGIHSVEVQREPDDPPLEEPFFPHAQVRFFKDNGEVIGDESIPLPEVPPGVPKTEEVYSALMRQQIAARHRQLLIQNS